MAKYNIGDEVVYLPFKMETIVIAVLPKNEAGRRETFYIVKCNPKKAVTSQALEPVNKALRPKKKENECIGCKWFVDIEGNEAYCFATNELVRKYIKRDTRPNQCIKGTAVEKLLNKGDE